MRALKFAMISAVAIAGCAGTASAQYDPYTPIIDEEGGVPVRCSIEYSGIIGQDRRKNDLAFKIAGIADSKAQPAPTVYLTVSGQSLGRSVAKLEITQAGIEAGNVTLNGPAAKPSETGSYGAGTTDEATLLLPLNMVSGSRVTVRLDSQSDPIVLTLPASTEATRQKLFSCFQRGTGFPESIRPENPAASVYPAAVPAPTATSAQ